MLCVVFCEENFPFSEIQLGAQTEEWHFDQDQGLGDHGIELPIIYTHSGSFRHTPLPEPETNRLPISNPEDNGRRRAIDDP